ncbi:RICIN domain-containing protein [Streptomyces alfalfae]|uniref:RICIN domain-containing protein n=1 Tax=Streptomyces alfalfae TaxID=1642299 RepID=A0A7T4TVV0_9ACTN|nr:RICIN domain-containing protein [Streptomyces alfalfae]QQC87245.1 RICIN domain-containing protein [Streptomyces alfalfae]
MPRLPRPCPHAVAPVLALVLALVSALLAVGGPTARAADAASGRQINIAATHTGMCLEVATHDVGEPVRQRRCAGREGALWHLKVSSAAGGAVHIVSVLSGKCMAVRDSSADDGAAVVQTECDNRPGTSFQFGEDGDAASIQPMTANPRKCLEVTSSATADGASLRQWTCDGQAGARFTQGSFRGLEEGWIKLRPGSAPGLCLTEGRAGLLNVPVVVQRPCAQATSPRTYLLPQGNGLFKIQWHSAQAGVRCLMVFPVSTVPDLLETSTDCATANSFYIAAVDTPVANTYRVHTLHTPDQKYCVGITGGSTAEGATARQEPCAERTDQVFFIDSE